MGISSPGVGSNLDVNNLVSQLMAIEKKPLATLNQKEAGYQGKITAYGSLKGALSSLQTAMSGLASASTFRALSATSSDTSVLTATAANSAVPGSYAVSITKLAQAQSLYAAGKADINAVIGGGASTTLQFQFGAISGGSLTNGVYSSASFTQDTTQAGGTITIDSSNNTLAGIRDAINAANIGVTATIVSDGSATPYRLTLTSNNTGAKSSMKIAVSGDATLAGLLAYDPAGTAAQQKFTQSAAAQDASLSVNGIAVTSATNTVSGAIQGVTLNLANTNQTATSVTVARNTAVAQSAIQNFVNAYNSAAKTIGALTSYDATTKQAGLLLGDATIMRIETTLRQMLTSSVSGVPSSGPTLLSQIGVAFQKDGTLSLDQTKLQSALGSNIGGVSSLFATIGTSSDALVNYVSASPNTQAGSRTINVSALATHGSAVGSGALGGTTVIDGTNDGLTLNVDGTSATLTLAHASYTPDQLAAQLQTAINAVSALSSAGASVSVSQSGGIVTVASTSYGSQSSVNITGGSALTSVFGAASSTAGTDIAGSIGSVAATGSGQILTGAAGSAAAGLRVLVTGGATGARGSVNFTRGIGDTLNTLLGNYLRSDGAIASRTDGLQKSIDGVTRQVDTLNQRLFDIEARYRAQFTKLDSMISSLNSTSNFLTQQLANLPKISGTSGSNN